MSATMCLELEEGLTFEDAVKFINGISGLQKISEQKYFISRSKIEIFIFKSTENNRENISAEGMEKSKWKVGVIMHFRLGTEEFYTQLRDIEFILNNIITQTKFQFVLSFQYEKIYACRDMTIGEIPLKKTT